MRPMGQAHRGENAVMRGKHLLGAVNQSLLVQAHRGEVVSPAGSFADGGLHPSRGQFY